MDVALQTTESFVACPPLAEALHLSDGLVKVGIWCVAVSASNAKLVLGNDESFFLVVW